MIKCKDNLSKDESVNLISLMIKCKDNWSNNDSVEI